MSQPHKKEASEQHAHFKYAEDKNKIIYLFIAKYFMQKSDLIMKTVSDHARDFARVDRNAHGAHTFGRKHFLIQLVFKNISPNLHLT